MENFHRSLSHLDEAFGALSPNESDLLGKIISDIAELALLYRKQQWHEDGSVDLATIERYLSKKLSEARKQKTYAAEPTISLRHLRNELAHGSSLRKYDPVEIKRLESLIWKTLEKSAPNWHPIELANLMSYCLNTRTPALDPMTVEPRKMVRIYKAIYNAFDEDQQRRSFKELTLRLFSEPVFRNTMEMMDFK